MKKIVLAIMALIIAFPVLAQLCTQDSTHSRDVKALVIVYDISYPKKKPFTKSINYNKIVTIIYGSKILSSNYSEFARNDINLSNDGYETFYSLFPNQKIMLKSFSYRKDKETSRLGSVQLETERTISATGNTKQIIKVNCDEIKIVVTSTSKVALSAPQTDVNYVYYYTYSKLKGFDKKYSSYNVDGLVLGSDYSLGLGCIAQQRAVSITEQMVDSTIFDFPKDYTILTYEELYSKKYKAIRKEINKEIGFGAGVIFSAIFNPYIDLVSKKEKTQNSSDYVASMNAEFSGVDSLKHMLKDTIADSYYYQGQYMNLQDKTVKSINKLSKQINPEVGIGSLIEQTTGSDAETLKYIQYLQYLMQGVRMQAESKGFLIPLSVEEAWGN